MKLSILILSLTFFLSSFVNAKTKSIKLVGNDVATSVVGSFQKSDNSFIYLKVKGARNLVKVPKKYSLNHPSNYNKGLVLKMELPLSVYMSSNLSSTKRRRK